MCCHQWCWPSLPRIQLWLSSAGAVLFRVSAVTLFIDSSSRLTVFAIATATSLTYWLTFSPHLMILPSFLESKCLFCSIVSCLTSSQVREEIWSRPGAGMDARSPDRSHCCRHGICHSHLWRTIPNERQASLESSRPYGILESLFERFFVDRNVPNTSTACSQSVLFEPSRQFMPGP